MRAKILLLIIANVWWIACARAQANSKHLRGETSPYVKRAVGQPVDWYPWGADAFKRAKALGRVSVVDTEQPSAVCHR